MRSLFTTLEIARATAGNARPPEAAVAITGVTADSRRVRPGDLFVALPGARTDGHLFVDLAYQHGAAAALVKGAQRLPPPPAGRALVEVEDTLWALGELGAYHRSKYHPLMVGVTGSVGKTSTKDLTHAVLGVKFQTLKSEGNLNSDVGLPLSLFHLDESHQAAVLEMAMRGPGQIRRLVQIARPHIGVLTNIGTAHLETLGSIENIASAKSELLEGLPGTGVAVLNWDCPWVRRVADRTVSRTIRYGLGPGAEVTAGEVESLGEEGTRFTLLVPGGSAPVRLPVAGGHMVANALAAAAVGVAAGLEAAEIAQGLGRAVLTGMRVQLVRRPELLIINDAYNANPQSMVAALSLLKELARSRAVAVLGGMLELGEYSGEAHREVGRAVAAMGVDLLITVGTLGTGIAVEAAAHGLPPHAIRECRDNAGAIRALTDELQVRDTVLVKGSRGLGMEEIVHYLEEHALG
ncbi:MAG TPA: UDP-N-acetylmuramoyl-tripeptide--D-alanyl-D-alanine ligase [Clostridiales bacterium UBA8153]|nr:UDP-N-acetylmuramoyl-tripeptide--D-alanyl-D-alanine ligase [Clostridiales bacterium UBA8153]